MHETWDDSLSTAYKCITRLINVYISKDSTYHNCNFTEFLKTKKQLTLICYFLQLFHNLTPYTQTLQNLSRTIRKNHLPVFHILSVSISNLNLYNHYIISISIMCIKFLLPGKCTAWWHVVVKHAVINISLNSVLRRMLHVTVLLLLAIIQGVYKYIPPLRLY